MNRLHTAEAPSSETLLLRCEATARRTTADTRAPDDGKVTVLWWVVPTLILFGAIAWWLA